jgi:F420 biosynthesis protein FbiB-like protein
MDNTPLLDVSHPMGPSPAFSLDDDAFWSLIRDRRSIRRYTDQPIDASTLTRVLEAATWAPSAHNRQPWRFCVVTDPQVKHALSAQMGERWRIDLTRDGAEPDFMERRVAASHARITGAAALIVPAVSMADMDLYPDARRSEAEWLMAVQSVALACQNLLLAAHHYGLGACWMCAPLFVPDLVRSALALPDEWHPQALITLGYPAEEKQKARAPLETRVIWR